jgi:uncharacterized protein YkwD
MKSIVQIVIFCLVISGISSAQSSIFSKENLPDETILGQKAMEALNDYRKKKNKTVLKPNEALQEAACIHSKQMAAYNFFSHINNKTNKYRTLENRTDAAGYRNFKYLGENIFFGTYSFDLQLTYDDLVKDAMKTLIQSPTHNKNMLESRITEAGICVKAVLAKDKKSFDLYLTQVFGSR